MRKGILTLLLALSITALAWAQDSEENPFDFTVLEDGDTVTGEFTGIVTGQLYVFIGNEGDEVAISMVQDPDSSIDPYLVLLDADGAVIAINDDSEDPSDAQLASQIEIQLPSSGLYLVLATQYGELRTTIADESTEGGEYDLTVSGLSSSNLDEEDLILPATLLDSGASRTFVVTAETPVHYVAFVADEGQTVNITTAEGNASPLNDTLLYVFDPEGKRIALVDDAATLYAQVELTTEEAGTYLVWATTPNYGAAADDPENFSYVGSFDLRVDLR